MSGAAIRDNGRRDGKSAACDVAIIGMACIFPGAPDLRTYWQNLVGGVDAIVDPPFDSWDVRVHYDPSSSDNDRIYCNRGGYLGVLAEFDPLAHGVLPLAVEGGEPEQWLALKVAGDAIADAGYAEGLPHPERTAVILGKGDYVNRGNLSALQHHGFVDQTLEVIRALNPELGDDELQAIRRDLKRDLPPFTPDTVPALIPNIAAGRIANRLDLMGPSLTIDAACASSLIAVDVARQELASGRCDMALVGGIHLVLPMLIRQVFCQLGALSRLEEIRPFDKTADGTILGEGVGMMVVQRLDDAVRTGRRIYAVVKGIGTASDGRGRSVMAPRVEGEILALRRAYEATGIPTGTIRLIEAHGTGTPVGDATEVDALAAVYGERTTFFPRCALGSVKSMLGHLMPAAGMAGMIKTALALHNKVLPPTLKVSDPLDALLSDKTPFYVNAEARPWIHDDAVVPRRAGVNAFGFGGINVHAILEEHRVPDAAAIAPRQASELLLLGAASRAELVERVSWLQSRLADRTDLALPELAYTLNLSWNNEPFTLAVVAESLEGLADSLAHAAERLSKPGTRQIRNARRGIYFFEERLGVEGRLAFLFPGEGSQYPGMLSELAIRFPEVRQSFETTERSFRGAGVAEAPSDHFFPARLWTDERKRAAAAWLWEMRGAVTSVLTADYAMILLLRRLGLRADAMLGHSTGEFPALIASGMIDLDAEGRADQFAAELHELFHEIDRSEVKLDPVSLVAVGGDVATVEQVIASSGGAIRIAMDNCPHQSVIAGPTEHVEPVVATLRKRGLICETLAFDRPYHTPDFAAFSGPLTGFLERWITRPPQVETYTCATKQPFPADLAECRRIAVDQWMRPVAFSETVEAMYAEGVRVFVELGARGNLSAFVDDILRGRPHLALPTDVEKRPGISQLNQVVALLAAHGVPFDVGALYADRGLQAIDLDASPGGPAREPGAARRLETGWPEIRLSDATLEMVRTRRGEALAVRPGAAPADRPAAPAGHAGGDGTRLDAVKPVAGAEAGALPRGRAEFPEPASTGARDGGAAPGRPSARQQIIGAHMQAMEQFLQVNQDVMEQYLSRRRAASHAGASRERAAQGRAAAPRADDAAAAASGLSADAPVRASDSPTDAGRRPPGVPTAAVPGTPARSANGTAADPAPAGESRRAAVAARENAHAAELPLVGTVVSLTAGEELVAERKLDPRQDLLLADHTFGRRISVTDPELLGMPVMPLTVSMEMMAEAASLLVPGEELRGFRDVRGFRWISAAGDGNQVRIVARSLGGTTHREVRVQVLEGTDQDLSSQKFTTPVIEATVVFGTRSAAPRAAPSFFLRRERPPRWKPEEIYEAVMFHERSMQGLVSIDAMGDDGARATIEIKPRDRLFGFDSAPRFLTDPVLLDQVGQVLGYWAKEYWEDAIVFPFYVEDLEVFGPPLAVGEIVECRGKVEVPGDDQVAADLEVIRSDGTIWTRVRGWRDRRFPFPDDVRRFFLAPRERFVSRVRTVTGDGIVTSPGSIAVEVGPGAFPPNFFTAAGGMWRRSMATAILARSERAAWREQTATIPQRVEWLLKRLAVKDATRMYLEQNHGLELCPADIEVEIDEGGAIRVGGRWAERTGRLDVTLETDGEEFVATCARTAGGGEARR